MRQLLVLTGACMLVFACVLQQACCKPANGNGGSGGNGGGGKGGRKTEPPTPSTTLPTTPNSTLTPSTKALPYVLRVSAFNIKTFGRAKMSDPFIAGIIRDIVLRYDVILIQEIRDISGEAIDQLWDMVGRLTYGLALSERLGRSSYKEQYAYFYRLSRLEVVATHQYDDGPDDYTDVFEREPYCIRLHPVGGSWDFALVGIHVKPGDAVNEIGALLDVYDDVRRVWPDVQDVMILGDLNADCSYATESDLMGFPIYNQNLFYWPINFDADTTTGTSVCAYDRFVLSGTNLDNVYIPGSADIFRFEDDHSLSTDQMLAVSDHYPIELELY